jgi:hypothetical protein
MRGLVALVDACVTDSEVALLLDRESLGVLLSSHVSQASMLEATEGATEGVFECLEDFLIGAGVASGIGRPASVQKLPVVSIRGDSSGTWAGECLRSTGERGGLRVSVDPLLVVDPREARLLSR